MNSQHNSEEEEEENWRTDVTDFGLTIKLL